MSERKVILNHSSEFDTIDKIKAYFLNTNIVGDALVSLNEKTEGVYAYKGMGEIVSLGVQGAQGAQGKDGTGVNVKASKDECVEAGDAYIDDQGNILIYNGKDAYVNGGQVMGPQGYQGEMGFQGEVGEKGEDGVQGAQGINGVQGAQGINGVQGVQGDLGVQGNQGVIGLQGSQGIEGVQGEKGIPGEMGYQGEKGDKGAGINIKPSKDDCLVDGDAYIKEDTGEILVLYHKWTEDGSESYETWVPAGKILGPQGVPGVQGPQGVQGDMGIQGNQGVVGLQGIQGSQGITGVQGDNGIQGAQGVRGDKGDDGKGIDIKADESVCENPGDAYIDENGDLQIYDGEKFNNGGKIRGPQGWEGERGYQGVQGSQGITGIQGTQGSVGLQGSQGKQGDKGDPGVDGDDGVTPIMGIRFDEDINRSYFTVSYDGVTTQDICPATYKISPKQPTVETLEAGSSAGVQSFLEVDNSAMTQTISFHFRIPKGDPGTGINIKANADACAEAGDAYIDDDGHIQILEGVVDGNKVFNDGGQIKGPQGAPGEQGEPGVSGTPGTEIVDVQASILSTGHGDVDPYVEVSTTGEDNQKTIQFKFWNITGKDGAAGGVYIPSVDESGELSWVYSDTEGNPPTSVNIKGKQGTIIESVTTGIQGEHSETPTCEVTTAGTADNMSIHFEFIGLQGAQGSEGDAGEAAQVSIVANTTNASTTGTPKVEFAELASSTESNRQYQLTIEHLKGADGNDGEAPFKSVSAYTTNPNPGTNATVATNIDTNGKLTFTFTNIKGAQGAKGTDGTNGADGTAPFTSVSAGTSTNTVGASPNVVYKISDNKLVLDFQNIKGDKGEDGQVPFDIVSASTTNVEPLTNPGVQSWIGYDETEKKNVLYLDFKNFKGVTYTPSLRDNDTTLTWANDGGKDNPSDVRVKGSVISAVTVTIDNSTAGEMKDGKPVCLVTTGNTEWDPTFNLAFSGLCGKAATLTIDAEALVDTADTSTRVEVTSAGTESERNYELQFYNLKGEKGDSGTSATVSIEANVDSATATGTPEVTFTGGSDPQNRQYTLTLKNLKGEKGEPGAKGDSVEISALSTGTQGHILVVNETQGYLSALTVNAIENIYAQDGSVYAENGFYEYSDENLKYFMNDIPVDFERLKSLPKKYFMWKNREKPTEIGTSAQKVQQIYPELVTTSPDGHLTVNYGKLSIVALKAIDMLYDRINYLESEIEILKK